MTGDGETDDFDDLLAEEMSDPDFAAAYAEAEEGARRRRLALIACPFCGKGLVGLHYCEPMRAKVWATPNHAGGEGEVSG